MKRLAFLALPLAIAACDSNAGNSTSPSAPVAAVKAPPGTDWTQTMAKTAEGYVMGNPDAPIKLVEYGARTCPTCAAFAAQGFRPLTERHVASGKVSFEFREYMVHGAADVALSLLGTCGTTPSTFFPVLERMYANQNAFLDRLQKLTPAQQQSLQGKPPIQVAATLADAMGAIDFVKQNGISETRARQCLSSQSELETVVKPTEKAGADGSVTGTPTFFINGEVVPNTVSWEQLETALKAAGA